MDQPVEDARGLQYLVDALRRVGQLLLCVRQRQEHLSLRVRVLQASALLPELTAPSCSQSSPGAGPDAPQCGVSLLDWWTRAPVGA